MSSNSAAIFRSDKRSPKHISVYVRVRPLDKVKEKGHSVDNLVLDRSAPTQILLRKVSDKNFAPRNFQFNRVWGPDTPQQQVFQEFGKNAVDAAFEGAHGVLFVYGQTGSGKTYTICNDNAADPGVLQRAMADAWNRIQADTEHEYKICVSFVQLYNEILTDLLDDSKTEKGVRLHQDPEKSGAVILVNEITGQSIELQVFNYDETMRLFTKGSERKEMASTNMNQTSSRSHTVFTLYIYKAAKSKPVALRADGEIVADEIGTGVLALEGRIVLCDLAGSERVGKTGAEGKRLDEAKHINGSLLILGRVVAALTEKNPQHAPFRESKLTRILQYSLEGNGNTSLVVNVGPSDFNTDETHSALMFGQRATKIKQDVKQHEVVDWKAKYMCLQAEIDAKYDAARSDAIDGEKMMYEDKILQLEEQISILQKENDILKQENASLHTGSVASGVAVTQTTVTSPNGSVRHDEVNWQALNRDLLDRLREKNDRLTKLGEDRHRLAALLAHEKGTSFKLADKVRGVMLRSQVQYRTAENTIDALRKALVSVKGTDYLNAAANVQDDDSTPPSSPEFSSLNSAGAVEILQDQLTKAYRVIAALKEEKLILHAYQEKARLAIRVLHADLQKQGRGGSSASRTTASTQ